MDRKRFFIFILNLILSVFLLFSFLSAQEKRYPPYPDVWGHEIIIPDRSVTDAHITIIKMRDGDYMITYTTKVKKIGKDFKYWSAGYLFFSGEIIDFGDNGRELRRIEDEARKENRWHRFIVVDFLNPKIVFSDGSSFERKGYFLGGCDNPLSAGVYYIIRDKGGIVKEKILLHLLIKPVKEEINKRCERNWDYKGKYYYRRVGRGGGYLVPLEDDTFLMVSSFRDDDRMRIQIIRFNKDFTTKVELMKYNLFMLDRSEYIGVIQKSKGDDNSNNEVVAEYLQMLKRGGVGGVDRK